MQSTFCLGKKSAVFDSRTLRFGAYLSSELPEPPLAINWGKNVSSWPMYLNNKYADCTLAAAGHMIQNWTAAAGKKKTPTDAQILKAYEHFTTPGPENDCSLLAVLKFWRTTGIAGDQILAFAQLEPRNVIQVKDAVSILGSCYIGIKLPVFAFDTSNRIAVPWVVPPHGPVGNAAPAPNGGHCVPAVAYDSRNIYVVTWGEVKSMSWQFYTDYADEAFAVVSEDFLSKDKKSPKGFNLSQLQKDLKEIERVPATRAHISRQQ